ncbi:endonuclease/exonuclease/phosphatase [Streptomyces rhizosphaericus]|uniref:endonuclease/exonuclease/phosphatase n=1 Tax=Streptomyces rhizosphaericus TaxID=114699 RepID=UPI002892E5AD|nr:endonuclease/exonuclease/phosphatase [Streptomyces rhizosphaericus]
MTGETGTLDLLTFHLGNPSREEAERQLAYLAARPEAVLVLTDTAHSAGCDLLAARFTAAGYSVTYPRPARGERGVMIVSRLATEPGPVSLRYLPYRAVSVTVQTDKGPLDVVGVAVPPRDGLDTKVRRKRVFLQECRMGLPRAKSGHRALIGSFNLLESPPTPQHEFLQAFESSFNLWLSAVGYRDAFRKLYPTMPEHSWVAPTGERHRFEQAHVSVALVTALRACSYVHEPRTRAEPLTGHSALTMSLAMRPAEPLRATDPVWPRDAAPGLP